MNAGKVASGVLLAAAAGAILGILFAPDKGSETRRKISKKGTDLKDMFRSKINDLVDDVANHYENIKDEAEQAVETGKEKVNSMKADAKHALS
jgi:gas vesicle protein